MTSELQMVENGGSSEHNEMQPVVTELDDDGRPKRTGTIVHPLRILYCLLRYIEEFLIIKINFTVQKIQVYDKRSSSVNLEEFSLKKKKIVELLPFSEEFEHEYRAAFHAVRYCSGSIFFVGYSYTDG